jgi:hypothetical protein
MIMMLLFLHRIAQPLLEIALAYIRDMNSSPLFVQFSKGHHRQLGLNTMTCLYLNAILSIHRRHITHI